METMLQKAARGIYEGHPFVKPWDHPDTVERWHPVCLREAKAALTAIMEPSEEVCLAACYTGGIENRWKAMIQSILSEDGLGKLFSERGLCKSCLYETRVYRRRAIKH